jgi:Flp pilus assembly protein TadG
MRINRRRSVGRPAATLVESAAVVSIGLLFMFGIFEYGRFVMTKQLLENAAREGARWAVANTYNGTTAQVQNTVDAKLSAARQQMTGYVKTTNISVYAADSSGNAIAGKNWNDSAFGENIAVEINGTYTPALPNLLKMNSSIAIKAKAVMASEAN